MRRFHIISTYGAEISRPKEDVQFISLVSGLSGAFLKEPPGPKFCNWFNGPCLLEYLDNLPAVERMGADKPLRMPIIDR